MAASKQPEPQLDRPIGCLARLFWMAVGNGALAILAIAIAREGRFVLSWRDVVFWAIVAMLVVVRWLDVTQLGGQTADAAPATLADWRRYVVTLLVISLMVWLAAHAIAATGVLT